MPVRFNFLKDTSKLLLGELIKGSGHITELVFININIVSPFKQSITVCTLVGDLDMYARLVGCVSSMRYKQVLDELEITFGCMNLRVCAVQ